jgi:hypothetical protein
MAVDALRVANWQRTGKKKKRPKPISPLAKKSGMKYGRTTQAPRDVQAYLARYDPAAQRP